jgi:hypothetical protein
MFLFLFPRCRCIYKLSGLFPNEFDGSRAIDSSKGDVLPVSLKEHSVKGLLSRKKYKHPVKSRYHYVVYTLKMLGTLFFQKIEMSSR